MGPIDVHDFDPGLDVDDTGIVTVVSDLLSVRERSGQRRSVRSRRYLPGARRRPVA